MVAMLLERLINLWFLPMCGNLAISIVNWIQCWSNCVTEWWKRKNLHLIIRLKHLGPTHIKELNIQSILFFFLSNDYLVSFFFFNSSSFRDIVFWSGSMVLQKNFDMAWCQGTVRDKIFEPWKDYLKLNGCKFLEGRKVTDLFINEETGIISEVICGKESLKADAVILAVGISTLQELIENRHVQLDLFLP